MHKTGTTESGSQVGGQEGFKGPYDRPSVTDGTAQRSGRGVTMAGSGGGPMPQSMGGITGSDVGGTGKAAQPSHHTHALMGTEGLETQQESYGGASGVAGRAGDYSGSRYGGGREQEETGITGASGFGHATPDAAGYGGKAHATGIQAGADTGYSAGLGNTGAQGAGASAETAHFATGGKAGLYLANEHVDP
ncbi:hypothetical protein CHLNCDRAFT_133906 [Chlorella variabilis]|uniref:Uncharacterized protein n=1 Tax=Chlorella variabilis TaxID=554065 RepID=E1ZEJ6_CHLVA|nr:hypothetical protein CHLNCDRAFT_133906 [Chlorella variabilis]EFN55674.1 hypothetical protein CHLNCDRAFT_133906 [Chlorella variabilis]|eukprot:XP_005847776.1 hypothetical protein CHLNCDRAFT_133906 [Chlorella variabilis]